MCLPATAVDPRPQIFLLPGWLHCAPEPAVVTTVLGSCVAVCLWDRACRLGGMNHYVLPEGPRGKSGLRYGRIAIDRLVRDMLALGCRTANLEAKIFGGAAVLAFGAPDHTVGTRNVAIAVDRLAHHRIPITAQRTGGATGLWIQLATESGHVLTRALGA